MKTNPRTKRRDAYQFESIEARELYRTYIERRAMQLSILLPDNVYNAFAPIIYAAVEDDQMPIDTLQLLCSFIKTFADRLSIQHEHELRCPDIAAIEVDYPPKK